MQNVIAGGINIVLFAITESVPRNIIKDCRRVKSPKVGGKKQLNLFCVKQETSWTPPFSHGQNSLLQ